MRGDMDRERREELREEAGVVAIREEEEEALLTVTVAVRSPSLRVDEAVEEEPLLPPPPVLAAPFVRGLTPSRDTLRARIASTRTDGGDGRTLSLPPPKDA